MTTTATLTPKVAVTAIVAQLLAMRGAKFVNLRYTAKGTGEVARHHLILGASTEELYKRDIVILETMKCTDPTYERARIAMLESRKESLRVGIGNNSKYTHVDTYLQIAPGIKVHKELGEIHFNGLAHSKTIIVPGTYKKVNSAPLTLAKKAIEKELPSGRFRQFVVTQIERIALNGEVIEVN